MRVAGRAAFAASLALLGACATPTPQLKQTGPDDFVLTKQTESLSDRSDKLKAQAEEDALGVCRARGKALSILDSRTIDPDPPAYASATIQFRCVPK